MYRFMYLIFMSNTNKVFKSIYEHYTKISFIRYSKTFINLP